MHEFREIQLQNILIKEHDEGEEYWLGKFLKKASVQFDPNEVLLALRLCAGSMHPFHSQSPIRHP